MVQDLFSKPIWCQICPKLEGSGFPSQLVHFFLDLGPWAQDQRPRPSCVFGHPWAYGALPIVLTGALRILGAVSSFRSSPLPSFRVYV